MSWCSCVFLGIFIVSIHPAIYLYKNLNFPTLQYIKKRFRRSWNYSFLYAGSLFLLIQVLVACNQNHSQNNDTMIWISNGDVKAGILPDVGGRVVYLSLKGKENILTSDSTLWNESSAARPEIASTTPFKAYNGHIVWLGPQAGWWTQQNEDTAKRNRADVWPPDPYLIYGGYTVLSQSDSSLVMQGPESKYSGVQLTKKISINENGEVYFQVTAKNIREEPVSWDLWLNTRLNGYATCFIPLADTTEMREDAVNNEKKIKPEFSVSQGYFTLYPSEPPQGKEMRVGKYFIYPDNNYMAAFYNDQFLFFSFPLPEKEEIHPEQAAIEIYNITTHKPEDALLEMELHSPYKTLQPGEEISTELTWYLSEADTNLSPEEKISLVNKFRDKY
mgnify:CR=1 FL=1